MKTSVVGRPLKQWFTEQEVITDQSRQYKEDQLSAMLFHAKWSLWLEGKGQRLQPGCSCSRVSLSGLPAALQPHTRSRSMLESHLNPMAKISRVLRLNGKAIPRLRKSPRLP